MTLCSRHRGTKTAMRFLGASAKSASVGGGVSHALAPYLFAHRTSDRRKRGRCRRSCEAMPFSGSKYQLSLPRCMLDMFNCATLSLDPRTSVEFGDNFLGQ